MTRSIYLDANATTLPYPAVREAVASYLDGTVANPSSPHRSGRLARAAVERSREAVARLVRAREHRLLFTSGGTESISTVFRWVSDEQAKPTIVTTTAEHSAVDANAERIERLGGCVERVPVTRAGRVRLDALEEALARLRPNLVVVHWVNGETGIIQDIDRIESLCARSGAPLLIDAAQAIGKMDVDLGERRAEFFAFSGHKFHAPQGVGGLFVREDVRVRGMVLGGEQESGLRAGTENVPGIVGLGIAAEQRQGSMSASLYEVRGLRDRFEGQIRRALPFVEINGEPSARNANTSNLRFVGLDGQAVVAQLDALGISCSQSSACTSARPEPSKVLRAMGLTEGEAYESVRFSFSEMNTIDEVEAAVDAIRTVCVRLARVLGTKIALGGDAA